MAFDPEKVERTKWVSYGCEGYAQWPDTPAMAEVMGDYPEDIKRTVEASDYDALLELYREAKSELVEVLAIGAEQVEQILKLTSIAREYRRDHPMCIGANRCDNCKKWDEMEGKSGR